MITVEAAPEDVERRLVEGELECPGCGGVLAGWGWGRSRVLRAEQGEVTVRPRRARCASCAATHVLLPVFALARRADVVEVVGAGLELAAAGFGSRRIAARLARPVSTVRGWVRRFAARALPVGSFFIRHLVALSDDPARALPLPAATAVADAVSAVCGFAQVAAARFGMLTVPTWNLVAAACHGRLLAPAWPS